MLQQLQKQIKSIDESLAWLKANKAQQYDARFLDLVEERRRLRKIEGAMREKPAIAAFGESQKGKSYLIGNLLQKDRRPFMVRSGADGSEVDFVMQINPIGNKKEATGVVTRFTSFGDDNRYSEKYPVLVKLFSVANIATILTDSYYLDILDYGSYSESAVNEFSEAILKRYQSRPEQPNPVMTEDDVLEIKNYLTLFAGSYTQNLRNSDYFDNVARVIRRVPEGELVEVLKYLWHENHVISGLFSRLLDTLSRLGHAREVYTTLEDVRHYGDNHNTFMSVDCLNDLDLVNPERKLNVYLRQGDTFTAVPDVAKCELCALCAETVYRIAPQYLDGEEHYDFGVTPGRNGDMPAESARKLPQAIRKDLLRDMDLLDFPGARSRLSLKESFLEKYDETVGASNSVQMLLRGKVAFLFNNYNESRVINILLFCHDNEQPAVTDMYNMLDSWVNKYVGKDAQKRRATIESFGGISPLFVVGTKFNVDMIEAAIAEHNNDLALNQRWDGRFEKVLYQQVFKGNDVDWVNNWDGKGSSFSNTYMLRDFKFSGCNGTGNNIYEGYDEKDADPKETALRLTPEFYDRMRRSFIGNALVKRFFADPALAWDAAATRNNDGAFFIIDNLTKASRNAVPTRQRQMQEEMAESASKVYDIMSAYHIDDDLDRLLDDNIRRAAAVMRELDFTTNVDNYFFGHMLQAISMTETEVLSIVHRLIQSPELVSSTTDWKEYELIRRRCHDFEGCADENAKWEALIKAYYFRDRQDAEKYLERRKIDPALLISGNFRKKSNSVIITDHVMEAWRKKITSSAFRNVLSGDTGFDALVLNDLMENIVNTARRLGLDRRMEQTIAEYVNIVSVANANESLVSDLLAGTISAFVNDMGFSMLDAEDVDNARRIAASRNLPAFDYTCRERKSQYTEEEIADLFNDMQSNPDALTPGFDRHYYSWLEYMIVSFIAHVEVPDYDKDANDRLGNILECIRL